MATTPRPKPYALDYKDESDLPVLFSETDEMLDQIVDDLKGVAADVAAAGASSLPSIAAGSLLGRAAGAGTGTPQQISLGSGLSMSGSTLSASGLSKAQALTRVFLGT